MRNNPYFVFYVYFHVVKRKQNWKTEVCLGGRGVGERFDLAVFSWYYLEVSCLSTFNKSFDSKIIKKKIYLRSYVYHKRI